jgi:hypothetical protein
MPEKLPEPRFYTDENGVEMVEHPMFKTRNPGSRPRQFEMVLVNSTAEHYNKVQALITAIKNGELDSDWDNPRRRSRRR